VTSIRSCSILFSFSSTSSHFTSYSLLSSALHFKLSPLFPLPLVLSPSFSHLHTPSPSGLREEESSAMERCDPIRLASLKQGSTPTAIGSHLAPLSAYEAKGRVEGHFGSNSYPISAVIIFAFAFSFAKAFFAFNLRCVLCVSFFSPFARLCFF
jgi:hypothetical protein